MRILIDGYNLLHISGILRRGIGRGTLHRARLAMLNHIASELVDDSATVTVVFDAKDSSSDLPGQFVHRGIEVQFAQDFEEADDLLEYLIRTDSAPRQLTVVSSDRRVQRAAKRRRANVKDSEQWLRELRASLPAPPPKSPGDKPEQELSMSQIAEWMQAFGFDDFDTERSSVRTATGDPPGADMAGPDMTGGAADAPPSRTEAPPSPIDIPLEPAPPTVDPTAISQGEKAANKNRQRKTPRKTPRDKPRQLPGDPDANPFPSDYLDELSDLDDLL